MCRAVLGLMAMLAGAGALAMGCGDSGDEGALQPTASIVATGAPTAPGGGDVAAIMRALAVSPELNAHVAGRAIRPSCVEEGLEVREPCLSDIEVSDGEAEVRVRLAHTTAVWGVTLRREPDGWQVVEVRDLSG